jgi:hypothetical protein
MTDRTQKLDLLRKLERLLNGDRDMADAELDQDRRTALATERRLRDFPIRDYRPELARANAGDPFAVVELVVKACNA